MRSEHKSIVKIVDILNQEGFRPTQQEAIFTPVMVRSLLVKAGVKSHKKTRSQQINRLPNEWTFQELSQKIDVPEATLRNWMKKNILKTRLELNVSHKGVWLITADRQEIKRLVSYKNRPKQWIYQSRVERIT